jgi:hypothetical protein
MERVHDRELMYKVPKHQAEPTTQRVEVIRRTLLQRRRKNTLRPRTLLACKMRGEGRAPTKFEQ